jgi:hypothetical protein
LAKIYNKIGRFCYKIDFSKKAKYQANLETNLWLFYDIVVQLTIQITNLYLQIPRLNFKSQSLKLSIFEALFSFTFSALNIKS